MNAVGYLTTCFEYVAPSAEPAKVAQLDRSAVDVVNFGGSPLVAANAAAVVLCQYLLAKLVAQSRPGVGQVESEEGDHDAGDEHCGQRVCAAAIVYRLPHVADLLGLLAAALRAEADVLLPNLGRFKRLEVAGVQPNPPLMLHRHRARLLPRNRTKRLYWGGQHNGVRPQHQRNDLCQYPTERCHVAADGWSRLRHK